VSPKRHRLMLLLAGVGAVGGAVALGLSAIGDTATYFYAPSDVAKRPPEPGREVRLGGLVVPGTIARLPDGLTLAFSVTDRAATTAVRYHGVVPDLFRAGSGVIATGAFGAAGVFLADQLLAKHDEKYMPPEVATALHKGQHKTGAVE